MTSSPGSARGAGPELDDELVHADPAADRRAAAARRRPRRRCRRAAGRRRRSRAGPARRRCRSARSRSSRTRRRSPASIRLTRASCARSRITGRERDAGQRGEAGGGLDPVRGDADPDEVEAGLGQHQGAGRVGQVPQLRLQPGEPGLRRTRGRTRRAAARPTGGRARRRRRGATRGRRRSSAPARSASAAAAKSSSQACSGAPLRVRPVSTLRCTRATRSATAAAADEPGDVLGAGGRDVDVGGDQRAQVLGRAVEPAQQRAGVAGRAQRQRLARGGDAEPGAPGRPGRAGARRPCRARTRRP